jgi:hypothetical protein
VPDASDVISNSPAIGAELRSFLRAILPEAMIPSTFIRVATLPLNCNGKVDKPALLSPEPAAIGGTDATERDTDGLMPSQTVIDLRQLMLFLLHALFTYARWAYQFLFADQAPPAAEISRVVRLPVRPPARSQRSRLINAQDLEHQRATRHSDMPGLPSTRS